MQLNNTVRQNMPSTEFKALRVAYLDASVAVKLFVPDEKERQKLLGYFEPNYCSFHMTEFCLHETLTALKAKWKRSESTEKEYLDRCYLLLSYVRGRRIHLDTDFDLADFGVFAQVEAITKKYGVDISDALQVITIKHGKFKHFAEESRTVFVSADGDLVKCAKSEGLRVWDFLNEDLPK